MTKRLFLIMLATTLFSTGCGLIYKQNIQQGNAIEQDDLDELYIGMNQRQVLFVLGTPSVKEPFSQNRWDCADLQPAWQPDDHANGYPAVRRWPAGQH